MTLTETYNALLKEFDIAQGGEMVYRFCDKGHNHSYLDFYERYFAPHRDHASILEIGVMTGGSLLLWQRWFDSLTATGIDLREGYNETFAWQSEIEAICHWGVDSTADEPAVEHFETSGILCVQVALTLLKTLRLKPTLRNYAHALRPCWATL